MNNVFLILLAIMGSLLMTSQQCFSQEEYPQDYFRSPLDIPLLLSGNFGELRTNHFHTGLDIKTQGVEGKKVYAAADGFISRIKKSPWGYGNVLYVEHPNGYTSVYAHLQRFNDEIEAFYKEVQFKKEQFHVDLYPGPGIIKVKKGEVIALSGNSGSSGGPHLHFEIRDTKTERPYNPMLFGFKINDNIPPRIQGIRVYSFPSDSLEGICNRSYSTRGGNGKYALRDGDKITLNGRGQYGLAVHTTDLLDNSGNICGVFEIEVFLDDKRIFYQKIDQLDFYTNRYMNAHTDYALYRDSKKGYHKNFIEPNNKLDIYKAENRGLFRITDENPHHVHYVIKDVSGNTSEISFTLQNSNPEVLSSSSDKNTEYINCCRNSEFHAKGFSAYFPIGTVYTNVPIEFSVGEEAPGGFSEIYKLNSTSIPVHTHYHVEIEANIPKEDQDKAIIVERDRGRLYAHGGRYIDGRVRSRVRTFGELMVMVDNTAPVVEMVNHYDGKLVKNYLVVRATDNLSGVKDFVATINGNWAPSEYDSKKGKYYIHVQDMAIPSGTHELTIHVTDERNNETTLKTTFKH